MTSAPFPFPNFFSPSVLFPSCSSFPSSYTGPGTATRTRTGAGLRHQPNPHLASPHQHRPSTPLTELLVWAAQSQSRELPLFVCQAEPEQQPMIVLFPAGAVEPKLDNTLPLGFVPTRLWPSSPTEPVGDACGPYEFWPGGTKEQAALNKTWGSLASQLVSSIQFCHERAHRALSKQDRKQSPRQQNTLALSSSTLSRSVTPPHFRPVARSNQTSTSSKQTEPHPKMTYANSQNHYIQKPTTIIQSRGSSVESRASSSRSSTDGNYRSSRTSMANAGAIVEKKHRVPDNDSSERHVVTSKANGKVTVINQDKGIYEKDAPLASFATSEDYKHTQDQERRERREQQRQREQRGAH
ncbi:hypothetical protein BKA61DRAFT_709090 [Leptodontidium sp. MPI-SDFR-AT-0119]|nr:hypothetical protein BKA61DRAFT_709090 [Leptodontidium sp. MPI-SDFR-AT-0119]